MYGMCGGLRATRLVCRWRRPTLRTAALRAVLASLLVSVNLFCLFRIALSSHLACGAVGFVAFVASSVLVALVARQCLVRSVALDVLVCL